MRGLTLEEAAAVIDETLTMHAKADLSADVGALALIDLYEIAAKRVLAELAAVRAQIDELHHVNMTAHQLKERAERQRDEACEGEGLRAQERDRALEALRQCRDIAVSGRGPNDRNRLLDIANAALLSSPGAPQKGGE